MISSFDFAGWLVSGLLLTGLTFFFGTYPSGEGPHLWLNLGDIYYRKKEAQKAIELYRRVGELDTLTELARRRLFCKVP